MGGCENIQDQDAWEDGASQGPFCEKKALNSGGGIKRKKPQLEEEIKREIRRRNALGRESLEECV